MRISRVYTNQPLAIDSEVLLEQAVSHHLLKVLRLPPETIVNLFNGQGGEYQAQLLTPKGKYARALIKHFDPIERESPLRIHLGVGVSRGDRFDWVIQKATELGVSEISPLITERTEVKLNSDRANKKYRHWQQISISACEQSGRNQLPTLNAPQKLSNWQTDATGLKLVAHHRSAKILRQFSEATPSSVCLLIGPEGGLSEHEIDAAIAQNFHPLLLGPRVLRTETAPLAAISVLQATWGDMGKTR